MHINFTYIFWMMNLKVSYTFAIYTIIKVNYIMLSNKRDKIMLSNKRDKIL